MVLNIAVKTLVLQDSSVISITSESASNPRDFASHWRLAIPILFLNSRARISWPKNWGFIYVPSVLATEIFSLVYS